MTETPKVGDWVRMSAEGVVTSASQFAVGLDNGRYYFWNTEKFNVEVVARVDDPANDPVGTVRRNSDTKKPFVKMAPNVWALHQGLGSLESWTDQRVGSYVQERPIIGVVPGTPAAEPAVEYWRGNENHLIYRIEGGSSGLFTGTGWYQTSSTPQDIRTSGDWTRLPGEPAEVKAAKRKPRVFHSGDPEPPEDVTRLRDNVGDILGRTGDGRWSWVELNGRPIMYPTPKLWGHGYHGPLTEVFEDVE